MDLRASWDSNWMDGSATKGVGDERADALAAALEPLPSWDGANDPLVDEINARATDIDQRR